MLRLSILCDLKREPLLIVFLNTPVEVKFNPLLDFKVPEEICNVTLNREMNMKTIHTTKYIKRKLFLRLF